MWTTHRTLMCALIYMHFGTPGTPTDIWTGPTGAPGPPGIRGRPGAQGATGSTGHPGGQGFPGRLGSDGAPGFLGVEGPDGFPGAPGPEGATGAPGFPGNPGAIGATGPMGFDGIRGSRGSRGARGRQGLLGFPGADGERGPPGWRGAPGAPGNDLYVTYVPGAQGPPGGTGPKGLTGRTGPPGIPGPAGLPGDQAPLSNVNGLTQAQMPFVYAVYGMCIAIFILLWVLIFLFVKRRKQLQAENVKKKNENITTEEGPQLPYEDLRPTPQEESVAQRHRYTELGEEGPGHQEAGAGNESSDSEDAEDYEYLDEYGISRNVQGRNGHQNHSYVNVRNEVTGPPWDGLYDNPRPRYGSREQN